jgi:hypothetical protein
MGQVNRAALHHPGDLAGRPRRARPAITRITTAGQAGISMLLRVCGNSSRDYSCSRFTSRALLSQLLAHNLSVLSDESHPQQVSA